ncbi:STAS domain-containing protein [Catenulispora subtropica]|uniref:Anti-sigma factor antagonist n=1 Tax=Catenulispora subtropica TaxID=450798 RepID=A0ABP5D0V1_9ACTN
MEFSCTAQQTEGRVVLTVVGDVDMSAHEQFLADVEPWASGTTDVVLDCSGVTFMDSMGLRVLVLLRQRAADNGHEFVLRSPSQPVTRVMEAAGVSELFTATSADSGAGAEPLT